jgi:hypothetical protein
MELCSVERGLGTICRRLIREPQTNIRLVDLSVRGAIIWPVKGYAIEPQFEYSLRELLPSAAKFQIAHLHNATLGKGLFIVLFHMRMDYVHLSHCELV